MKKPEDKYRSDQDGFNQIEQNRNEINLVLTYILSQIKLTVRL